MGYLDQMNSYDEFVSVYKGAIKPHIEIRNVAPKDILVVIDDSHRGEAALDLTAKIAEEFSCDVEVIGTKSGLRKFRTKARALDSRPSSDADLEPNEVLNAVKKKRPDLVVLPTPFDDDIKGRTLGSTVDVVVSELKTPCMLVKGKIRNLKGIFSHILAYVPGEWGMVEEFSWSFTLIEKRGLLELLHAIPPETIKHVEHAIAVTPGVNTTRYTDEVVKNFMKDIDLLLKDAVRQSKKESFTVKSQVVIGDPVQTCATYVKKKKCTLLVIKTKYGKRAVEAESYEIAREVRGVPILVL